MRTWFVLAILVLCLASCTQTTAQEEAQDSQELCAQNEDFWDIVLGCSEIINSSQSTNEERVSAYVRRGAAFLVAGSYKAAIDDFDKALELQPHYADALRYRGISYYRLDEYDLAIQDLDTVIRREHPTASDYAQRGEVYRLRGDFYRAMLDYSEAIRREPYNADLYNLRGMVFGALGMNEAAIDDYNEAILLDPDSPIGHSSRGYAYQRSGDYAQAMSDYEVAIGLNPEYASVHHNRAQAYLELGQPEEALRGLDETIRLSPYIAGLYADRGSVHASLGRDEQAANDWREAARLEPRPTKWNIWAQQHYREGNHAQALKYLEIALTLDPEQVELRDTRAHALAADGRLRESMDEFDRVVAMGGSDWATRYQEALVGHGYDVVVDGDWGAASRQALESCLQAGCRLTN